MDVTPQSIMDVKFREKVRGYHPADVDAFVSEVAAAVGDLQQRLSRAESRTRELEERGGRGASETEETLRRTLVLAQRTADLAVQEAREEATRLLDDAHQQRDGVLAEVAEMRARMYAESEEEIREHRERLHALRDALLADVQALEEHLSRERERLRIYFTDQLRRVEEGEPGMAPMPPVHVPAPAPPTFVDAADEVPGESQDVVADDYGAAAPDGSRPDTTTADDDDGDPFMAELRRAATDDQPLGPRDPEDAHDDDGFDLFTPGDDESGRFGGRRRRRR